MGLEQEVVATGRERIKEISYSKEPDHSWKPIILGSHVLSLKLDQRNDLLWW